MNTTRWAVLKIVLISPFVIPVILHRLESSSDATALGISLAIAMGLLALFQLLVWVFYDVATLKRGGWISPQFSQSPFSRHFGPGLHLGIVGVALLTFGFTKLAAAAVQGVPSLIIAVWLLAIGAGLLIWQTLLRWLFRRRFASWNGEPGAPGNSRPAGQCTGS
jgi:hypothetical protein